MKKYSVEIAHIYQDEDLDLIYIEKIKKSIKILNQKNIDNYYLKVLIDDINIKEKKWEIFDFIFFLEKNDIKIDAIAFESDFSKTGDLFLKHLDPKKLKWEYDNENSKHLYIKSSRKKIRIKSIIDNKEKYSCAYLSACWQLCRLGVFKYPNINLMNKKNIEQTNEVINILEKKYEIIEKKVKIIIKEIINLEKIDNIYF